MALPAPSTTTASAPPPPADGIAGWRIVLRIFGAFFVLAIFAYWAAAGWNRGWTKDKIAAPKLDEVTGIEYVEFQDHFVPGIDFLTLGSCIGIAIAGSTFFFRKKPTITP
jgi:hypothetical protein